MATLSDCTTAMDRVAYAEAQAEMYAEHAAERYARCQQAARKGDRGLQRYYLTSADNITRRAEAWAAVAIRNRVDVRAAELAEVL